MTAAYIIFLFDSVNDSENVSNYDKNEDVDDINIMPDDIDPYSEIYCLRDDMDTQPYSVCMHHELRKEAYEFPDLIKDEIKDYLDDKVASPTTNILDWWEKNSLIYPTLSLIAKDFLAQQSSSVPSERAFSKTVDFLTKKRNRMSPSTLKHCLSLNNWDIDIWQ
ncbi:uncharacterized protein LOC135931677 [Gordionus sp. m RMFG-2023]|uniref:uncharacterized protein LOC135931677 n=1 Tax=Gordionus sp. m RMFG-2023 TaxID=3053472 RepID=UPI0031FCEFF8